MGDLVRNHSAYLALEATQSNITLPQKNILSRFAHEILANIHYSLWKQLPFELSTFYLPVSRYPEADLKLLKAISAAYALHIRDDSTLQKFFRIDSEFSRAAKPVCTEAVIDCQTEPNDGLDAAFSSVELSALIHELSIALNRITTVSMLGLGTSKKTSAHSLFLLENYQAFKNMASQVPGEALLEAIQKRKAYLTAILSENLFSSAAHPDTKTLDTIRFALQKLPIIQVALQHQIQHKSAEKLLNEAEQHSKKSVICIIEACIALIGPSQMAVSVQQGQFNFLQNTQLDQNATLFRHSILGQAIFSQLKTVREALRADKNQDFCLDHRFLSESEFCPNYFELPRTAQALHAIFSKKMDKDPKLNHIQNDILIAAQALMNAAIAVTQLYETIKAAQLTAHSIGKYGFYLALHDKIQLLSQFAIGIKATINFHTQAIQQAGWRISLAVNRLSSQDYQDWASSNFPAFVRLSTQVLNEHLKITGAALDQLCEISADITSEHAQTEQNNTIVVLSEQLNKMAQLLALQNINSKPATIGSIQKNHARSPSVDTRFFAKLALGSADDRTSFRRSATATSQSPQILGFFTNLLRLLKTWLATLWVYPSYHPHSTAIAISSTQAIDLIPLNHLAADTGSQSPASVIKDDVSDTASICSFKTALEGDEDMTTTGVDQNNSQKFIFFKDISKGCTPQVCSMRCI